MAFPTFTPGYILTDSDMNAIGVWLVKTQTIGSAVSSVAVTGAFSSSYDNYLITVIGGTASVDTTVGLQLGASTTGYYGHLVYGGSGATTVLGANSNNANKAEFVGGANAGQACHVSVDVLGPNLAAYTKIRAGQYQNGANYGTYNAEHRVATAYTDFTLIPSAGTLTGGTIRVYGYKNS